MNKKNQLITEVITERTISLDTVQIVSCLMFYDEMILKR